MRSLFNLAQGAGLQSTVDRLNDEWKWKIWSNTHLEVEGQLGKGRFPVFHCVIMPKGKILIGGSIETFLDAIFKMSLIEFDNLSDTFPVLGRLLESTYSNKIEDIITSRCRDSYSSQVHWYLLREIPNPGMSKFTNSTVPNFLQDRNITAKIVPLVILADEITDDITPSTPQLIWRGVKKAFKDHAAFKMGGFVEKFIPKIPEVEGYELVSSMRELVGKYQQNFIRPVYYDIFTK